MTLELTGVQLRMRRNATAARMAGKLSLSLGCLKGNGVSDFDAENPNGEIDENFWAQAAAERADLADDPDAMGQSLLSISSLSHSFLYRD